MNIKTMGKLNFFALIVAAIVGSALYRNFNFETKQFENTGLAIIYGITLLGSLYILIKDLVKPKL